MHEVHGSDCGSWLCLDGASRLCTNDDLEPDHAGRRGAQRCCSPSGGAAGPARPPSIELVRPDISRPIQNPVTIEVHFIPGPGGAINMNSFNATCARLGINITRRLLEHAEKTASGLVAHDIELPSGNHRVTLSIADTTGKTASRTFNLSVAR